jgi:hypothetical protein
MKLEHEPPIKHVDKAMLLIRELMDTMSVIQSNEGRMTSIHVHAVNTYVDEVTHTPRVVLEVEIEDGTVSADYLRLGKERAWGYLLIPFGAIGKEAS